MNFFISWFISSHIGGTLPHLIPFIFSPLTFPFVQDNMCTIRDNTQEKSILCRTVLQSPYFLQQFLFQYDLHLG